MKIITQIFINFASLVLTVFLITFCIPLAVLTYLPFFCYRQLIIVLAKIVKRNALGKIVSSRSSILISEDIYSCPRGTLVSFLVLEGEVDLNHVRNSFQKRVIDLVDSKSGEKRYPELKQNVSFWMGFPFWRNLEKFCINEQIHFHRDDGNLQTSSEFALDLVRSLSFAPFSKDKPLWEIVILPNFTPDPDISPNIENNNGKYSGVIIRSHHGLADAFSQLGIVQALSKDGEKFEPVFAKNSDCKQKSQPLCYKVITGIVLTFMIPFAFAKMMVRRAFIVEKWNELEKKNRRFINPSSREEKPSQYLNNFISFPSASIPLSEISEMKKIHRVSVTALLYSAVVGAARNTVFAGLTKIPKNIVVATPLPLPRASKKLRNEITMGTMTSPLAERDPIKRLQKVYKSLNSLKKSVIPSTNALLMKMGGSLPRHFVKAAFDRAAARNQFMVISNVAGPKEENDFAGYPIKDFFVSSGGAAGTSAISVSLLSNNGRIRMSVGADKRILETEEKGRLFIQHFFNELAFYKKHASFCEENV